MDALQELIIDAMVRTAKRAPKGYHIERWSDGFYHVYFGGECLDECLTRKKALKVAFIHKKMNYKNE